MGRQFAEDPFLPTAVELDPGGFLEKKLKTQMPRCGRPPAVGQGSDQVNPTQTLVNPFEPTHDTAEKRTRKPLSFLVFSLEVVQRHPRKINCKRPPFSSNSRMPRCTGLLLLFSFQVSNSRTSSIMCNDAALRWGTWTKQTSNVLTSDLRCYLQ